MSEPNSGTDLRALLCDARSDAPDARARADLWQRIATATVLPAIPPGSPSTAPQVAAAGTVKAAFAGALLGSTLSGAIVVGVLRFHAPAIAPHAAAGAVEAEVPPRASAAPDVAAIPVARAAPPAPSEADRADHARPAASHASGPHEDELSREADLVAGARAAMLAGDPVAALAYVRATRTLTARQLGPEETAIEVRALRALGRGAEADDIAAGRHTGHSGGGR